MTTPAAPIRNGTIFFMARPPLLFKEGTAFGSAIGKLFSVCHIMPPNFRKGQHMSRGHIRPAVPAILAGLSLALFSLAEDSEQLLTVDHYVLVKSTVPVTAGQMAQIYVRERVKAATALRNANLADRVVLFVHGAGTPAEVAFDVPHED